MKVTVPVCCGVIVVAVGAWSGLSIWAMNAPAVPHSKIDRLQVGMSQAEVRQLLGKPGSSSTHADGSESWAYSRLTWAILHVHFDARKNLTHFVHDE